MKMNKTIISQLLMVFLVFVLPSCKKSFVDLTPVGIVPVGTYYKTELDIQTALTGVYNSLKIIYNYQWLFSELPSDNTQTYTETETAYGELDKYTYLSTSNNIKNVWSRHYAAIAYCNIILGHIESIPMAEVNKNSYMGQVKFIRGLMYFNLVRLFGGVPLVLQEITSENEALSYSRASITAVYTQIEHDLQDAALKLPTAYTGVNIGHATSIAAKGLLGKVYIYEKKFPEAVTTLAQLLPNVPKPLTPYDKIFGVGNDNNPDIVFSIQYLGGGFGEGNNFASAFAPAGSAIVNVGGTSANIGTQDLYDTFEPGDLRKDIAISQFGIYYYAKKFVYKTVQSGFEGDNDWPVLRFAEIVLLYAEALNETGKTDDALTQLNLVRVRSGLPAKTGLLQEPARTAIQHERRVELCFEGERWLDLIRWDTYIPVMNAFLAKYKVVSGTFGKINTNISLLPIPYAETSVNPNLSQNPGY